MICLGYITIDVVAALAATPRLIVKELSHAPNQVVLEIDIAAPVFDTDVNGNLHLNPLTEQIRNGDFLAGITLPLRVSRNASIAIVSHEEGQFISPKFSLETRDHYDVADDGKPGRSVVRARVEHVQHLSIGTIALTHIGVMRATDIARLTLGVYDPLGANGFRYAKRFVIRVSDPHGISAAPLTDLKEPFRISTAEFRSRQAQLSPKGARIQAADDVQQLPGIQSDDGHVYRMFVQQSGVYHVTYEDLKQFGIDPSTIDPKTLRIINKGQQVPVYIFDHQDGELNPDDYFEFFGEEKLYDGPGTYGDFHYDPDSKYNVYFLVWGDHGAPIPAGGLKRIVEESGEIREASKSKYSDLADSSFPSKLHFEVDAQSDPLEVSDIDQRSNLRDHQFWKIIPGGQVASFPVVVPFPNVRANRPVTVRAALHGISHFDPGAVDSKGNAFPDIPNEHIAEIAINGQSILQGTWDSQEMKFLSTDTASQRMTVALTAKMLGVPGDTTGGEAPLLITVANRKTNDQVIVRFGVNWFEVNYDRLYYAYKNALTFHAPRGSADGLYQFTLHNFSRTDISIYRKGVSKLSNYVINQDPKSGEATTVFQIHATGDADEFIAIVDSQKLKPVKYEQDDYINLRDPATRGAYLIITSREHLRKSSPNASNVAMELLLDYREKHNGVSGKLVDVANIYDEFSSGARSPEAIKKFLKYAYDRWAEPPKYVLIDGVTHPDNPPPGSLPDQVPTAYIQAYLEGAVASDTWYSLLDGDDLVPDILLGRLASVSLDDDLAYYKKVVDYEQDPAKSGDWKDRALFVGVGGFNSQIDGLLNQFLPRKLWAERIETKRNDPYFGTDQTFVDQMNKGLSVVTYLGHGGNGVWADPLDSVGRAFFVTEDISRLKNFQKYPCAISLTCFTAGYDGSQAGGLLNSFNTAPNAGMIAGFGTTAFGWQLNDFLMGSHVLPHVFDSIGGTWAERILSGKIEYYLQAAPGDLIPPTLVYAYQYLGDPLLSPNRETDRLSLSMPSRTLQPGAHFTLRGLTSMNSGQVSLELCNEANSPLVPRHVINNVPISNGTFSYDEVVPSNTPTFGNYRAIAFDDADNHYADASADVTFSATRVTELDYEPHPIPASTDITFIAAVQAPQGLDSAIASVTDVTFDANGSRASRTFTIPMVRNGDRYQALIGGAANGLQNGDRLETKVLLYASSARIQSDSIVAVIGAAADPSAFRDLNHRATTGRYHATASGLVWRESVYNWGGAAADLTATLLDEYRTPAQPLGSQSTTGLAGHAGQFIDIPVRANSLDSALFVFSVAPAAGGSPFNLRDSLRLNDSTTALNYQPAAVEYTLASGSTIDGSSHSSLHLNSDEVVLDVAPGAEANIASDVIRLWRQYDVPTTTQPDIHFLPMYSDAGRRYASLRVISDSLGSIPLQTGSATTLTIKLNLTDSIVALHASDSIYLYRQDDRSKLWTILRTRRSGNLLTAEVSNFGTFALAYNTDARPPVVDMTVEGQVFSNNGEVPPQPHIHAVLQDANGIDVTPGRTVVKIDNKVLDPSQYVILDSSRTPTTINLRMEPSLGEGNHTITVQATDNNGRTNAPPKELDVHVSKDFGVGTLGSYPNPFTRDYMFIAYEIRGIAFAESVALDIYTVSGRRIRTLTFPSTDPTRSYGFLKGGTGVPTSLGYHEVWWDGRDDSGNEVANGAYFYRLLVKTTSDERTITGKFARVR